MEREGEGGGGDHIGVLWLTFSVFKTRPRHNKRDLVCRRAGVTPEMNGCLTAPFTSVEVTQALSHISPLKSPGPDGFPAMFFHKF